MQTGSRFCWYELWLGYIIKGISVFIPSCLLLSLVGMQTLVFCVSGQRHKVSYLLPVLRVQMKFALLPGKNIVFMLLRTNSKVILEKYWKMFRKSEPNGVKSDLIQDPGNSLVRESNVVTKCLNKNIIFKTFCWCTWSWSSCFYVSVLICHHKSSPYILKLSSVFSNTFLVLRNALV